MGRGTRRHGVVLHAGLIGPWPGERRERHFHDPGGFRGFEHPKPSVIMNQASAGMSGAGPGVAAGMPAVVIATAFGGPEVLSVTDQPTASPGPGEARVEVRAAGVNPIDWRVYSGMMGADPARLPMRLGQEAAGVLTAVGPGAVGPAGPVAPGDAVIAFRVSGAYAAELVVPAQSLVPKPPALDWPQAAGLMVTGAAAWHTLVADRGRIATIAAFGRGAQAGIKVLGGGPGADPGTEIRAAARLELARLAQDGKLRVFIAQTFPLTDAAAAH